MTSSLIHQPHDKLFKRVMRRPKIAREFFAAHLPPEILSRVDLSTLAFREKTFIDEAFKKTEGDLVYSVKLEENTAYFYLLCEQQSEVDADMPLRLLGYTLSLIKDHRLEQPDKPLPLIFPLVLYSGAKPWTAAPDIFPLFGEQADLARSFWSKPYTLIDIHRLTDDELKRRDFSGLMEYVLKYHQTREVEPCLSEIFAWFKRAAQKDRRQAVLLTKDVVFYFSEVNTAADKQTFQRLAEQHLSSTTLGSEMMTLADQFRQEGMEIGMQKGMTLAEQFRQEGFERGIQQGKTLAEQFRQEGFERAIQQGKTLAEQFRQEGIEMGIQQGMQKGEATVVIRLLARRFGPLSPTYLARIEKASATQLLAWEEKIFYAASLEELFKN